jgi:ureidoacrylate peracid hydrolase
MQNDFCHRDGFFGSGGHDAHQYRPEPPSLDLVETIIPRLLHLLDAARSAGCKVYFIRSFEDDRYLTPMARLRKLRIGRNRVLCAEGEWGSEQLEGFMPRTGETVITKHVHSAFIGTNFQRFLEEDGIESLIITGVATNICCESTIRDGSMLGFYIIVPGDCVAAYSVKAHEWSLRQIDGYWGLVTTSSEIIATWRVQQ